MTIVVCTADYRSSSQYEKQLSAKNRMLMPAQKLRRLEQLAGRRGNANLISLILSLILIPAIVFGNDNIFYGLGFLIIATIAYHWHCGVVSLDLLASAQPKGDQNE